MHQIFDLLAQLENPVSSYRSLPFWAWNDRLEIPVLFSQMQKMKQEGMGGFFIHSREGLETPYLSEKWMEAVSKTLDQASMLGLEIWIYDEDKWPSGSAGGLVSAANPEQFTAKVVSLEKRRFENQTEAESLQQKEPLLALYQCNEKTGQWERLQSSIEAFNVPTSLLIARVERSRPSNWYNQKAPTDMMNPKAIQTFISLTHEAYASSLGDLKTRGIEGFFTDEPNVYDFFTSITKNRPYLPWSEHFLDEFKSRRGYTILDELPSLFFEQTEAKRLRFDYWLTISELFQEAYTKQIATWCTLHRMKFTGHMLYENDLGYQIRTSGGVMPHYRYLDMPAIDLLGDQREEYLTVKQCTSVANQFGKQQVLSETYGCTGWDLTFQEQKRIGDWQYVMGVTRRCQHLALYSISGCRKRDYPPSFNHQVPWFEHLHFLEEYFARLSVWTRDGRVQRDILLLHPLSSFWMESRSSLNEDLSRIEMNMGWLDEQLVSLNKKGDWYNHLAKTLLEYQFDFDFGDEQLMKTDATVEQALLCIGLCAYRIVIVGPVETLMGSTALLLERFLQAGGYVVWMGGLPSLVDARPSTHLQKLASYPNLIQVNNPGSLLRQLKRLYDRPLTIEGFTGQNLEGFLSMTRRGDNHLTYIVHNREDRKREEVTLLFSESGVLFSYNLWEGCLSKIEYAYQKQNKVVCHTSFEAEETKVFMLDTTEKAFDCIKVQTYHHPHEALHIISSMPFQTQVKLSTDNTLPLDICSYRIGSEAYSRKGTVWMIQRELRTKLGMRQVFFNGAPQRYTWVKPCEEQPMQEVSFRFQFEVEFIPASPMYLAVEKSKDFLITCNNTYCPQSNRFFLDQSFTCFQIPSLTTGTNEIIILVPYTEETEFEEVYLLGSFSVTSERTIARPVTKLSIGDWCFQGLKHYAGNVVYQFNAPPLCNQKKPVYLCIKAFSGTLVLVGINRAKPLAILRSDTPLEVGHLLSSIKVNFITLTVVGSLRNLLGPFHRSASSCSRISWEDFRTEGEAFSVHYQTKPQGILDEVILYTLPQL